MDESHLEGALIREFVQRYLLHSVDKKTAQSHTQPACSIHQTSLAFPKVASLLQVFVGCCALSLGYTTFL